MIDIESFEDLNEIRLFTNELVVPAGVNNGESQEETS